MKNHSFLKYCTSILLIFIAVACTTGNKEQKIVTVTIQPQKYFAEKIAGDRFNINCIVPPGSNPEAYDPSPSHLVHLGKSIAYFKIGHIGFELAWMDKLEQNNPVYNRNDFFCYGISSSEYTGGAHGMYSNRYYTIDLSNWKRIGLDDIFQPDSSDTLSSILLNRLMKQLNVSSPDSLLELGYFDTEDIMATENFYLTDTGICWVYNPYEIACYATGQTSIEIPFKEIDSYILPDSPVRRLIK